MTYIVEVRPPKSMLSERQEASVYIMSNEYLFVQQAKEVAKTYKELGCNVKIWYQTNDLVEVNL